MKKKRDRQAEELCHFLDIAEELLDSLISSIHTDEGRIALGALFLNKSLIILRPEEDERITLH
jgi:hypothetical protein